MSGTIKSCQMDCGHNAKTALKDTSNFWQTHSITGKFYVCWTGINGSIELTTTRGQGASLGSRLTGPLDAQQFLAANAQRICRLVGHPRPVTACWGCLRAPSPVSLICWADTRARRPHQISFWQKDGQLGSKDDTIQAVPRYNTACALITCHANSLRI